MPAAGQIDAAAQTKTALGVAEQRARQAEASLVTLQRERDNLRQQLEAADRNLAAAQTAAASRAGENTRQLAELQLQLQQAKEELAELHSQNQSLHETSQRLEHEKKETADAVRQLAEAQTALEQMKHRKLQPTGLSAPRLLPAWPRRPRPPPPGDPGVGRRRFCGRGCALEGGTQTG